MPIYPIECTCGFNGDTTESHKSVKDGLCPCPKCNAMAPIDFSRYRIGAEREFHGDGAVSMMEGCHPSQVREYRENMGPSASRLDDKGNVRFKTRGESRQWQKDLLAWGKRNGERAQIPQNE